MEDVSTGHTSWATQQALLQSGAASTFWAPAEKSICQLKMQKDVLVEQAPEPGAELMVQEKW